MPHPPRTRWQIETYDPAAREWYPAGLPLTDRQTAVEKLTRLTTYHGRWADDGTTVQRRIVLETTTYTDLTTDPGPFRLPKGGFLLTDTAGQDLAAIPAEAPDGRPAIRLAVGSYEVGHADVTIPLEHLEEVVAGLRDMARQAGGQPPAPARRTLAAAERQFLAFALDLAADCMADRGDEFTDEDDAALARLRQLAEE